MAASRLLLLSALASIALCDVYMHNPRGSNNRLNERSANRNNGNRLFDSQNNNRGGYNKGDNSAQAFTSYSGQYDFQYYMSAQSTFNNPDKTAEGRSVLTVEWTNQHGCGGNEHDDPHKLNCNILLQYMCYPDDSLMADVEDKPRATCDKECFMPNEDNPECIKDHDRPCKVSPISDSRRCELTGNLWLDSQVNTEYNCVEGTETGRLLPRDGLNTNRPNYNEPNSQTETPEQRAARYGTNFNQNGNTGFHETWEWYDECYRRERNRGLFTADQNLRNNNLGYSSAIYTRQNPNNNRRGLECPEERDYWPYWHPSPWVDIAVMTDREDLCPFYQSESQNVKPKGLCRNNKDCLNCVRYNNEKACIQNNGDWVMVADHGVPAPECIQSPWSRVNHLGNSRDGQAARYEWTLPYLTLNNKKDGDAVPHRCVLRLRYNISTDDYDAWRVNASFNNNNGAGIVSPVRQNPNIDIGAKDTALRLAINTAQFGRTFQDRSHVFRLVPRTSIAHTGGRAKPASEPADFFGTRTLYNLNVRGKRGNIVQTFPSVEYDFMPTNLKITEGDLVHIQWAGSNTHNNGNPAGDGQAGDAGEGRGGTDRHNFVEMKANDFDSSFPATEEENTIFANMLDALDATYDSTGNLHHPLSVELDAGRSWDDVTKDWMLRMASVGYYSTYNGKDSDGDLHEHAFTQTGRAELNELLNNADASYVGGVFRFKRGSYDYMCTRNHNFSNRDQKGHLIVDP